MDNSLKSQYSTLISVELLRAIAALAVVYYHCTIEDGFKIASTGAWGVDIFFVISGFIVAYSVSKDVRNFMLKRILRIVPLYFIATFLVIGVTIILPNVIRGTMVTPETVIKSLLFIPYEDTLKNNFPLLGQGWTLRFEMVFYLLMALCILIIKNKKYLPLFSGLFLVVLLIILNMIHPTSWILNYYKNGLWPEFIYGLVLYYVYTYCKQYIKMNKFCTTIVTILLLVFTITSFCCLIAGDVYGFNFSGNKNIQRGIPALIIVMTFLFFEKYMNLKNPLIKIGMLLGEASYVMYLFHLHVIAVFSRIIFFGLKKTGNIVIEVAIVLFIMFITMIVSIILYKYLDKPIQKKVRSLLKKINHQEVTNTGNIL
jgi:peptidoglycan/LPS O-acetylase OafA/YrhL